MKLLLGALVLFASFSANASDYTDGREAVKALLSQNPVTNLGDKVSDYVAASMLSSFDSNGNGALTVASASCEPTYAALLFSCELFMLNSDRKITKDGAYAEAKSMTESSTSISFTIRVDPTTKDVKVVGEVTVFQAG